jgi:hypothetical protein
VRHMIRHLVKLGHYQAFLDSMVAWNEVAVRNGLPAYRIWESQFGTVQEVFTESDFESIEAHLSSLAAAQADPAFASINEELAGHLVDGSLVDYVLEAYEPGRGPAADAAATGSPSA